MVPLHGCTVHAIIQEVHADIQSYLLDWEMLDHSVKTFQKDESEVHHKVLLYRWQWVACQCYSLGKDFEALKRSSDTFLCVYVDRWS
jgi:hypothetical protein